MGYIDIIHPSGEMSILSLCNTPVCNSLDACRLFRYACGTGATAASPAAHTLIAVPMAMTAKIQLATVAVVSSSLTTIDHKAFVCH